MLAEARKKQKLDFKPYFIYESMSFLVFTQRAMLAWSLRTQSPWLAKQGFEPTIYINPYSLGPLAFRQTPFPTILHLMVTRHQDKIGLPVISNFHVGLQSSILCNRTTSCRGFGRVWEEHYRGSFSNLLFRNAQPHPAVIKTCNIWSKFAAKPQTLTRGRVSRSPFNNHQCAY